MILSEMPRLVNAGSFPFEDPMMNSGMLDMLTADVYKKVSVFSGIDIYQSQTDKLFCFNDDELLLYCQFIDSDYISLGIKSTTQTLIWKKREFSPGIASYIFWNILLPRKGSVLSDSNQSAEGKKLWEKLVSEALSKNLFVYSVIPRDSVVTKILNISDFEKSYSSESDGALIRILISEKEQSFKSPMLEYVSFLLQ